MNCFAHSNGTDKAKWEPLNEHLTNTAEKTSEFCAGFGFSELGKNTGYLHDIGKYQKSFQDKLDKNNIQVEHSICGAKEAFNIFTEPIDILNRQIIAYAVAGHHSGLPDYGTEADDEQNPTLSARLQRATEDYSAYKQEFVKTNIPPWVKSFNYAYANYEDLPFALSVLTKLVFSALVDADSLETERFYNNGITRPAVKADFIELKRKLDAKLESLDSLDSLVNIKRTEIRKACENAAEYPKGLFSLTVPTGGGKTLSSMSFALNHLIKNGHRRIIYVIPYTAIIEQTANVFEDIFGEGTILQHHSNFTFEESKDEDVPLYLATENWDAPIILTTNVQFFDSLFSNKRGNCRKLHNITNSVIIFDEAQMLPIPYLRPCLRLIDILTRNFNCSALLMSATCPDFKQYMHSDTKITEINGNFTQHYLDFKRVSAQWIGKKSDEELVSLLDYSLSSLIIVNTRKHARDLFSKLPEGINKYHLSTLMTPEHRKRILANIRTDLEKCRPCVVVSTQLIECGVDLDFAVVYRSLAGIDSLVQAGGRCNREGKRADSKVYIFEAENSDPCRGDIPIYKSIARTICEEAKKNVRDIFELDNINEYFKRLLNFKGQELDILNIPELFRIGLDGNKKPLLKFDFAECAKRFKYIDDADKYDVVIPYTDEARKLIAEAKAPLPYTDLKRLHNKLGQYTVSIYRWEYNRLRDSGKLEEFSEDGRRSVLADITLYNDEFGLDITGTGDYDPSDYIY